jgi:hypothetical protein
MGLLTSPPTTTIDRVFNLATWSPQKGVQFVVAGALLFAVAETLLALLLRPTIGRLFRASNPKLARDPKRLRAAVTAGIAKLVGTLHNSLAIPMAAAVLLSADVGRAAVGTARTHAASPLSLAMCVVSASYFLYDLGCCLLRFEQEGPAYLVHAMCCLYVYGYAATFSQTLHWHGAGFLFWELSTVFVHVRWFLYQSGRADTQLYLINGALLAATFFLARNVGGALLSLAFFRDTAEELRLAALGRSDFAPAAMWAYRVANVALNALNAVWFYKIASKAGAMIFAGKKAGEVHDGKEG